MLNQARMRTPLVLFFPLIGALLLRGDAPSPGRTLTTLQRLEESHLAAVSQARAKFAKDRHLPQQSGVYTDYRAVLHVHAEDAEHTKGTRAEVLAGAKEAGVNVVMFTDHRGPKPETWSGLRDGVLFIPGSEDDHLLRYPKAGADLRFLSHLEETPEAKSAGFDGMEIYNRHTDSKDEKAFDQYFRAAMKNPDQWAKLAALEARYPTEIFGAQNDYWPTIFAMWDKELASHPFTGIAANDAHKNQTYNGVTFDPYEISFRDVSTHVLARELTDPAIRESLRAGRAYVSHDWLCDPTGFSFNAGNNYGVYDMGDHVPLLKNTRLVVRLPLAAEIRIIHNGAIVKKIIGAVAEFTPPEPGAYRMEAWLSVDGEERPWIYSNAIMLEAAAPIKFPSGELSSSVEVRKNISYIPDDLDKHKLDVYVPKGKSKFPILIFFHGGSWKSGDRSNYPALANRFAKAGIGVVVPSYRLMPAAASPAQTDDALAAVEWTIKNIEQFGGNPQRIYVSGHSAGGHLAAYAGLNRKFWPNLKGVLPLSGVYDVSKIAGFKDDANASPMTHIQPGAPPFLITYCQNDYPGLPDQARKFYGALQAAGIPSELVYVPNENHISEIVDVYKDDDLTANSILKFIGQHP